MNRFQPNYKYLTGKNGITVKISKVHLNQFNSQLLNIGDITLPSKPIDVLAVIFDLEGFTNFTKQIDPQLSIPNFVNDFCNWIFSTLRSEMQITKKGNELWAELPFFSKFLGDGILFLWQIQSEKFSSLRRGISNETIQNSIFEFLANIIVTLDEICEKYQDFYFKVSKIYVEPPTRLRCGIARGFVFPIGGGFDYIGPCINLASRLQKFNGLSFAFSMRGINFDYFSQSAKMAYLVKKCNVRGIGDNELVGVLAEEYELLPPHYSQMFLDV